MMLRTTFKTLIQKPVRLIGTLFTYVVTLSFMLALISVLVATISNPGPAYLLDDVDLAVRVDVVNAFNLDEVYMPESLDVRVSDEQLTAMGEIEGVSSAAGYTVDHMALIITPEEHIPVTGIAFTEWNLDSIAIVDGVLPGQPNQVMVSEFVARQNGYVPGDHIAITSTSGPQDWEISGIFEGADELNSVIFLDASASQTTGHQFVAIQLEHDADIDRVTAGILGLSDGRDLGVIHGSDIAWIDPTADASLVADFGALLGVMAGFMGFVAIFVILSTTGFAIQQRASQIAIERAVGYTPKQVRLAVVAEVLLVTIVGSILGYLLAMPVADVSVRIAQSRSIVPGSFSAEVDPLVAAIMIPSTMLTVLLVAWWASRRTLGISPVAALRDARAPKDAVSVWRWLIGLILIIGGLVTVAVSTIIPPLLALMFSLLVIMLFVSGIAAIGPAVVRLAVTTMIPFVVMGDRAIGSVAVQNARKMASRMASGAIPVMLGTGFLIMMFLFNATLEQGAIEVSSNRDTAQYYVLSTTGFLPADTASRVQQVEGVETVNELSFVEVFQPPTVEGDIPMELPGYAVDREAFLAMTDLNIREGSLEQWVPGTVIVSDFMSFDTNLNVGTTREIVMPDGTVKPFDVVGIVDNTMGSGEIFFHRVDLESHRQHATITQIGVNLAPEGDFEMLADQVHQLQQEGYPLMLVSRDDYLLGVEQSMNSEAWATYLIVGSAAALGMIASVNTLAMSTLDRSREFALMRLIGATHRQIMNMTVREGLMVGVIGVGTGLMLSLISAATVSMALVGNPTAVRAPVLTVAVAMLAGFAVCVLSLALPTRFALGKNPIEEIGTKE